jgi:hypothetical protein
MPKASARVTVREGSLVARVGLGLRVGFRVMVRGGGMHWLTSFLFRKSLM